MIVMCSGAFIDAFRELASLFERGRDVAVEIIEGTSVGETARSIPARLRRGEAADLAILFDDVVAGLASEGLLLQAPQAALAKSSIAVAVRAGGVTPDVTTVAGLRRALLAARSIAYSPSRSGDYVSRELFAKLGVAADVGSKAFRVGGRRVGDVVADGGADIGFQQLSELLTVEGVTVAGPLPREVQQFTTISAGVPVRAERADLGRGLIAHLTSPESDTILRQYGLDPMERQPPDST